MLRLITRITFQQVPTGDFPTRTNKATVNFVNAFEIHSSWRDLTDKGKITLPKNIKYINAFKAPQTLEGKNKNLGGFSNDNPFFLRGDKVTIVAGYAYFDSKGIEKTQTIILFVGYISRIASKSPFVLELEDNMWKLKQIPAPNKYYVSVSLEAMLQEMIAGTGFKVNALTKTDIGNFMSKSSETVAATLARLRHDYGFESYFRRVYNPDHTYTDELRSGVFPYIEQDAISDAKAYGPQIFQFQLNIIEDDLQYERKDDITLSAVASSVNTNTLQTTTKDGHRKTKKEQLEVLVTYKNGKLLSQIKKPGQKADFAPNTEGERQGYIFPNVTDPNKLIALAQAELMKYCYTGFRGKFTTFGLPYVRHGDNIQLIDNKLPERSGVFKVRGVEYRGGVEGLRQIIELDYKILI